MIKIVTLLAAAERFSPQEFQRWFLEQHVPVVLRVTPELRRYEVLVADIPCSRANHGNISGRVPAYDVVVEAWIDASSHPSAVTGPADAAKKTAMADLAWRVSANYSYRVEESIERNRTTGQVGRLPGMRDFALVRFLDNLSETEIARRWDAHVGLVLANLRNMTIYVRNYVREILTPGAPSFPACASLNFETLHDWENATAAADPETFLASDRIVLIDGTHHRFI